LIVKIIGIKNARTQSNITIDAVEIIIERFSRKKFKKTPMGKKKFHLTHFEISYRTTPQFYLRWIMKIKAIREVGSCMFIYRNFSEKNNPRKKEFCLTYSKTLSSKVSKFCPK
jgi:hypothetical protein